jgi:hypothetical protein
MGDWQSRRMTDLAVNYPSYRFPPEIISHAVWLYHRFCVSFRDTEDLLAQRGITVSYEAIGTGVTPSVLSTPGGFGGGVGGWAIRGTWTNCSSASKVGSSISGGPSTRTVT